MSESEENPQVETQEEAKKVKAGANTGSGVKAQKSAVGVSQENVVYLDDNIAIDLSKRMPQFDNGESLAYVAKDGHDASRDYVALISDQGQLSRWRVADSYESLSEASLLRLYNHGVVYWPPLGKQQYAFVYRISADECIISESGFSNLNWRQTEINDYLITPMARILKTMSDRNFSHGSIRADNIFFSRRNKGKPIILGDCLSVFPHSAQPAIYMSVEKSAAEPYGRGNGTMADDIYAFGVSIAMILRKNDEFEGLSDRVILQRKIDVGSYAAIVGSERFQIRYIELLRGLLHDDSSQRWTVEEIFLWLDGTRMTPPALQRRKKASRSLVFCGKKYLFPDSLALALAENVTEALKIAENGELARWVEKAFNDKELNENYLRVIECSSAMVSDKDKSGGIVTHIVLALNPMLPIFFNDRVFTYDGIGGLMARTCYEGGDLSVFEDAMQQNVLDLAASMKTISQNEILSLIKSFDVCRTILRQKRRGNIEKCVYQLCPIAPCFSPSLKNYFVHGAGSCLRSFEDLAAQGGQIAIFMDQHSTAFFSINESRLIERVTYDLNQSDKDSQIAGNLRFLAMLQKKAKIKSLPAMARVFADSLSGVYTVYNNIKLRDQIIDEVKKEAKKGNLIGMSSLIDNHVVRQRDSKAFQLAKREYKFLQHEYDQYNRGLADKNTYGVANGQEVASLISWIIAMVITVMSVFAFMSGYRIF